jgi:8-oxo-dGTP diphosphatase
MINGRFIGGVAAVVVCERTQRFLLLQRAADRDFSPGVWEFPAGRLHQGEGFETALYRELREELGLELRLMALLGTTHFYRGPRSPENELIGLIYLCTLDSAMPLHISPEHQAHRWVTQEEARALLTSADDSTRWLLRVLERARILLQNPGHIFETFDMDAG